MSGAVEKLTDEERGQLEVFREWRHVPAAKALRIIDRLTAALEAARASHLCPCGEREARLLAAESRAEALQARVAELEADAIANEECIGQLRDALQAQTQRMELAEGRLQSLDYITQRDRANAAEAELADLRGRVAKAIRCLRARGLINRIECALEALRGR